jgi:glycosyltransferase involved in cell wall biosynthesis
LKILGICLIKNEGDIIEETLRYAATWCDHIIVDDNGSEDGTWETVQRLAKELPSIIPWRQKKQPYHDQLRGQAFREFRHLAGPGDWWTKLDSDERYIDEPRAFLAGVPLRHHVVWAAQFQYYFTEEDLQAWEAGVSRAQPVHQRLHHYRLDYAETRFFRHRAGLVWPEGASWPRHLGIVHPQMIRNRHFQYRSPEQIQRRLETRQQAMREGCGTFQGYCDEKSWREKVVPAASCEDDRKPGVWKIDYAKIPRHLEKTWHRILKYTMHATGVWA